MILEMVHKGRRFAVYSLLAVMAGHGPAGGGMVRYNLRRRYLT